MNIVRDEWYMSGPLKVRVICTDAPGGHPVITVDQDSAIRRYDIDGIAYTGMRGGYDLKPIPLYADFKIDDPVEAKGRDDWLNGEEFYNAMQGYRTAPISDQREVVANFENVKRLVRLWIMSEFDAKK